MTKQTGLLFTEAMVLANLHWGKTQTRRKIRFAGYDGDQPADIRSAVNTCDRHWKFTDQTNGDGNYAYASCPYGQKGDLLYGRETLYRNNTGEWHYKADANPVALSTYTAPILLNADKRIIPSIHMPREAARLWLEITDVRAEPLHSITFLDALAEGIQLFYRRGQYMIYAPTDPTGWIRTTDPVEAYVALYNQINGITVEQSPWNWVIEYKAIEKPTQIQ